jgi:hypothetical protein
MQRKRIIKDDGRYLIFYTFEDEFSQSEDLGEEVQPSEEMKQEPEGEKSDV